MLTLVFMCSWWKIIKIFKEQDRFTNVLEIQMSSMAIKLLIFLAFPVGSSGY